MVDARQGTRPSGRIEERAKTLRVVVFAGYDPATGKRSYLRETVRGTDKAAHKRARTVLNRLAAQAAEQLAPTSAVSFAEALDEWMRVTELEDSTRKTYQGYIARSIKPALGSTPVNKINARALEHLYTDLRRCRVRCDGKPFVEHRISGPHECSTVRHRRPPGRTPAAGYPEHDCAAAGCTTIECQPHTCKPMAASTVQQIHSIISGTLSAAVRWDWLASNPARTARAPRRKPPQPDPPTATEAAKLVEEAFRMDDDWGTLVWLLMTTGMRRGEICGLHFSRVDLDAEAIDLRSNWVGGREKDTKTHQVRRIALDSETVTLLREHKARVQQRVEAIGAEFTENAFVFGSAKTPDHSQPYSPNAITQRYKDMAARLNIDTHLHALRHYSATELLTEGVDLRTVAGRLGHGGGGATTLKVYAAWVAASDRKAAEILGSRMPRRASS